MPNYCVSLQHNPSGSVYRSAPLELFWEEVLGTVSYHSWDGLVCGTALLEVKIRLMVSEWYVASIRSVPRDCGYLFEGYTAVSLNNCSTLPQALELRPGVALIEL